MDKNIKWTIYQIIAFILLLMVFLFIHYYMNQSTVQRNVIGNSYMIGALIYFPISWIYITIYFQQKKDPRLMEHPMWRLLPALLIIFGIISIIVFIMLVTIGPFMDWIEQSSWLSYPLFTYACVLYFLFIMSIVYKMNEPKHNVVHYSYIGSLLIILIIYFLF